MNIIRHSATLLLLSAAVSGQARLTFEVASIRPSERNQAAVGVRVTGSQMRISAWPLKEYLSMAYGVRPQQITGPDWLTGQLYDIAATIPVGVSQERIPEMLQSLFADRFQLKAHMEKRNLPVYALAVAKDGLKIKELPPEPLTPDAQVTDVVASGGGGGVSLDLGGGSSFRLVDNRIEIRKMEMDDLAELITRFVDRPVIDTTGLAGRYDMTLPVAPEDYTAMMMRAAISSGVQLPPQALQALNAA